ncbi:hypothetical protein [Ralstonia solanacearum]|uniref:hypothetical protein n=1 Tax=Ralstonia solanacearum TaxID=305 RepID=UPI001071879A|nr:hypothetical protein [Ralstonia solanacearum]
MKAFDVDRGDANRWRKKRNVELSIFWECATFLCIGALCLCMSRVCTKVAFLALGGAMLKAEAIDFPGECVNAYRRSAAHAGRAGLACDALKKWEHVNGGFCRFFRGHWKTLSRDIPLRNHTMSRSGRRAALKIRPGDSGFESEIHSLKQVSHAL